MFEHLANCHGEWTFLLTALSSLPFIGAWARAKLNSRKCDCPTEPAEEAEDTA